MKNDNNSNSSFFTFLLFLFLLGNSQWLAAQAQDPLVIENNTVKVNGTLEVKGKALLTELSADSVLLLSADSVILTRDLEVKGNAIINSALIGAFDPPGTDWAMFSHKKLNGVANTYALAQKFDGKATNINIVREEDGNKPKSFIGFNVNGNNKMIILQDGSVGIATIDPGAYKLNVNGAFNAASATLGNNNSKIELKVNPGNTPSILFSHDKMARIEAKNGLGIWGQENGSPSGPGVFISAENNVGIGRTSLQAKLHVSKSRMDSYYKSAFAGLIFNNLGNSWKRVSAANSTKRIISILAEGDIITKEGLFTSSDIRLKKNILPTSTLADLSTLQAIEVVGYQMIDHVADNRSYKKVIAQQVQEVYPLAVREGIRSFVPSVFQASQIIEAIGAGEYRLAVATDHELAVDDRVDLKCYPGNSSVTATVSRIISPTEFVVQSETDLSVNEFIFVYGKQVDDFLSVDYDAIAMLNVSATQELAKQVEQLQQEKQAQAARITELEKQLQGMEALKASVEQLQLQMKGEVHLGANLGSDK